MAAVEGLGVGPVREGHLDLDEHVSGAGLRPGDFLDAQVARAMVEKRSHRVRRP